MFFRHSDVVSTGDIFDPTEYPIIDLKSGGSLQGVLEGLNRLKQMAIPASHQEGGTMIIPAMEGFVTWPTWTCISKWSPSFETAFKT